MGRKTGEKWREKGREKVDAVEQLRPLTIKHMRKIAPQLESLWFGYKCCLCRPKTSIPIHSGGYQGRRMKRKIAWGDHWISIACKECTDNSLVLSHGMSARRLKASGGEKGTPRNHILQRLLGRESHHDMMMMSRGPQAGE